MSYSAILTHVEVDPKADARLRLAVDLANQFGAALIGVGAEIFEPPAAAGVVGYVDGATMVAEAQAVQDDLKRTEARFAEAAAAVRGGAEWRCGVGLPSELVVQEARAADLIVCGPRHAESLGFHNQADPGDVLMKSGRPVLVAPEGLERLDASHVLVAWKDTREARRAVVDALPFLKRASRVVVAEAYEQGSEAEARARVADVAAFLARHEVKAAAVVRPPAQNSSAMALFQVAEVQDAGLIVAGGYGHARVREWLFGGVTQELLTAPTRAVLLSH